MRSPLLLLLLLPSIAAAQTTTVTLGFAANQNTTPNGRTLTVGQAACGETVTVNWSVPVNVCGPLQIYLVDSGTACADTAPTTNAFRRTVSSADVNAAAPPAGGTGHAATVTFTLNDVFAGVPPTGGTVTACGRADVQETRRFRVCGATQTLGGVTGTECTVRVASTPDDLQVIYDHEKPAPPAPTVRPGERKLIVTVPASDEIDTVSVEYRLAANTGAPFTVAGSDAAGQEIEIEGLENNTAYVVRATQTDFGGNVSDYSALIQATPLETVDFWEKYKQAGGTDEGGCGAAGGAGLSMGAALAVVGLWLASRRRAS